MLAGSVEHGDSLGNKGKMTAGDVQWMTAGSGILQQEMPKGDPHGRMHGFQLWANLPSSLKMTDPRYQDIPASAIPEVTDDDGTRVRIICGEFWGKKGPVEGVAADPNYLDISVAPRPAQAAQNRNHAQRFCLRVRGLWHVPRLLGTPRRSHRIGSRSRGRACVRRQQSLAGAFRPRGRDHPSRPATQVSGSCWYRASRSRSRLHGTARS